MFDNGESFIHRLEKIKTKHEVAKHEEELEKKKGQPKETPITHYEPSKHIEKKAKDSKSKDPEIDQYVPYKDVKDTSSTKYDFKPKSDVSFPKGKNEDLFVLAGIEEILDDSSKISGALGAVEILNSYMGGKADPSVREFIDNFKSILKRNNENFQKKNK